MNDDTPGLDSNTIITFEGVRGRFGGHDEDTLRGVSFAAGRDRITAIVGETGSGKSLTALTALGIAPRDFQLTSGRIIFDRRDLTALSESELRAVRGARIAMVFQDARTALNPVFTVGRQIADVCRLHTGVSRKEAWTRAVEALERVHITDPGGRAKHYPHELSTGMAQRAMIAMGLICTPELLILDEPTTGLDVTVQAEIMNLILDLTDGGMTALLITHDLGVVAETCEDVVVMRHGQVVENASAEEIFTDPSHEYTRQLLNASRTVEAAVV